MDNRANKSTAFPPFYVGQKVVCVKDHGMLSVGKVYGVLAIMKTPCCGNWIVDVGVLGDAEKASCHYCSGLFWKSISIWWLCANRFAPIESKPFPLMTFEKIKETEKEEILIPN